MQLKQLASWRRIYEAALRGRDSDLTAAIQAHKVLYSGPLQDAALIRARNVVQNVIATPSEIKARLHRINQRIDLLTVERVRTTKTLRKEKAHADPATA